MSGIAVGVAFDGDPSIVHTVQVMADAASDRGPFGAALWHREDAALSLLRHDGRQHSPAAPVSDGRHALVFDGRIDNRDDLIARLSLKPADDLDDAALALSALASLGEAAVDAIDGDFALVLWDVHERRLIAARDGLGVRPLHWTRLGQRMLVASDVSQLVSALGAVPPPDESSVADLLSGHPAADERTLFRGIQRVAPGSVLVADSEGVARRRYWQPSPVPPDPSRSEADYGDECRALLDDAVRARLRGAGRPAVFFSGGLDSSIVLTIATSIARHEGRLEPLAISLAFDDPAADETMYQRMLARELGAELATERPDAVDANELRRQAARRYSLPDLPSDFAGRRLRAQMKAAGARFALTGAGADVLFGGSVHRYADLLARGRIVSALKEYARDRTIDSAGWSRTALLTAGLWPLIPAPHRARLRRAARRINGIDAERSWLRLRHELPPPVPDPPRGVPYASWEIACSLQSGWIAYFLESAERIDAEMGVEERHPFWSRRLIEFALALPESERYRDGLSKVVLRRAVPELPPMIGQRRTKGDFGSVMRDSLAALGGADFFRTLGIAETGWVDGAALAARYDRLTRVPVDDRQAQRDLPMLWIAAATDVWFRAVYDRKEALSA
jgi:asparagine synthase (glutamine-hydrolysing)